LIDGQLPPVLAERLNALGHDACHVYGLGLGAARDVDIWSLACREGRVLITKDQDFIGMARSSGMRTPVIWIRLGNTTNRALWRALGPSIGEIVSAVEQGEPIVEIR
jgi:predicted nuclease of predicted toxin-antitoxin system